MKLSEWLEKEKMELRAFAFYNNFSQLSVYNWVKGKFKPMKIYQKIIHEATKGEVTYEDWK